MPAAILRRRWAIKPPPNSRLNRGHPLAAGLAAAYLLGERGSTCVDLLGRNPVAFTGPAWGVRSGEPGPVFDGTGAGYLKRTSPVGLPGAATPVSIYARTALTTTTANQKIVARWDDGGGGSYAWLLDAGAVTAGKITLYACVVGASNRLFNLTSTNSYSTTRPQSIVATSDGAATPSLSVTLDGIRTAGGSFVSSIAIGTPGLSIGAGLNGAGVNNPVTGAISFVAIWARVLPTWAALEFREDPWALLAPPGAAVRYFVPTVAAGPTYPQLERRIRGMNRGVFLGAA